MEAEVGDCFHVYICCTRVYRAQELEADEAHSLGAGHHFAVFYGQIDYRKQHVVILAAQVADAKQFSSH